MTIQRRDVWESIDKTQLMLLGIAISTGGVVWVMGWEPISNIFKPDYIKVLEFSRMSLALFAFITTCFTGYKVYNGVMMVIKVFQAGMKIKEDVMNFGKDKQPGE